MRNWHFMFRVWDGQMENLSKICGAEEEQQPSSENKHRFYRPPERPSFVSWSPSPPLHVVIHRWWRMRKRSTGREAVKLSHSEWIRIGTCLRQHSTSNCPSMKCNKGRYMIFTILIDVIPFTLCASYHVRHSSTRTVLPESRDRELAQNTFHSLSSKNVTACFEGLCVVAGFPCLV